MKGRVHILKTWPEPFRAVRHGEKRYEIRHDDRGFTVGDFLHLKEWEPSPKPGTLSHLPIGFTGRECMARVLYMTPGGAWGLPPGLCVMSIEIIKTDVASESQ